MFCDEIDIEFMSTPFDEASAEFLNELGMRRFKIPSGEVTNIRLIRRLAGFGKPIVLSTGMSNLEEIGTALGWIRDVDPQLKPWLMQCVSAYPAPIDELNLLAMDSMSRQFNLPVGFSDHSLGISAALAAAALGAVAIEKHFTLNRNMEGPDHKASLEPAELRQMIQGIREVESALGDGAKTVMPAEREVAFVARRSIVAARDLPAGAVLADSDLLFKRPGTGISAGQVESLIGRVLKKAIVADTLLDWSMIE
jgi:sialic acid synthase SpsE